MESIALNEDEREDLYGLLQVDKHATKAEIKKAYYKMSLKYHPDRNAGNEEFTEKFQAINRAYTVLSDEEKRGIYDRTGEVEEGDDHTGGEYAAKVTKADIDAFARHYKHSEEEEEDLMRAYVAYEGSMYDIMDDVILSAPEDEARFKTFLRAKVASGALPRFQAFEEDNDDDEASRLNDAHQEAVEAEAAARAMGMDALQSEDDFAQALIDRRGARHRAFVDLIEGLEARYVTPQKSASKARPSSAKGKASGSKKAKAPASASRRKSGSGSTSRSKGGQARRASGAGAGAGSGSGSAGRGARAAKRGRRGGKT